MKFPSLFRTVLLLMLSMPFISELKAQIRTPNALTGTYRLDPARSDNPAAVADRLARTLPGTDQQRLRDAVTRRLQAPDSLALDIHGRSVTMASSNGRQVTFDADGRTQTEVSRNGRMQHTISTLSGSRLTISTAGDRALDYQLTFDLVDNGRSLRVTRSVTDETLRQPVISRSFYEKTAPVAQLDFGDRNSGTAQYGRDASVRDDRGGFIPAGTVLTATLNDNLDTKRANEGDRFTLNVTSPPPFSGAVIKGHVDRVKRSGQVAGRAEMSLDFDRIRMRDGRTADFQGDIETVSTPNGETINVDNEGRVQNDNSQTDRTVSHTGIGAAIGAVIGAIAGGGKGAAIGAAVGAGAGATSVFIQGRDDLNMTPGTTVQIRSEIPGDSRP